MQQEHVMRVTRCSQAGEVVAAAPPRCPSSHTKYMQSMKDQLRLSMVVLGD